MTHKVPKLDLSTTYTW